MNIQPAIVSSRVFVGLFVIVILSSVTLPKICQAEQLITAVVEEGPFAINSLYLSGEGPGRIRDISIGELIANKETIWLEPTQGSSKELAAISNQKFNAPAVAPNPAAEAVAPNAPEQNHDTQAAPGQRLYWSRGAKLEIIDEDGKVLSHPEFLCHSLIAINGRQHWAYFPQSSGISENFVFNFSQGITDIMLPDGFGIPLNSNERFRFEFKSLNRTTDQARRIKCRWTLYFVADKELTRPIQALNLFHSGIAVLVGGAKSPNRILPAGCGGMCGLKGMSKAKVAPNDVLHNKLKVPFDKNEKGEEITWHWVIPPGRHSYRTMHPEHNFGDEGPIRAAGAHVHPFCEKISLIEVMPDHKERVVFTINSQTDASKGIKIAKIDYLTWPTTGISLKKEAQYGWEVTYNNTSGEDQDSMAGVTLYFSDLKFQKPTWAL